MTETPCQPSTMKGLGPSRTALGMLVLTLLAFALRLCCLDFQPLWGDEGWSFYFASMPLSDMLALTAVDIHPPLYYALLHGWLKLTGGTAFSARMLSVVFGTLLVPLVYRTADRVFARPAGFMAAVVATLAPFAIYYAQEVRMYGLVTLLGLGSVFFFSQHLAATTNRTRKKPGVLSFWGYILTTTAALYTMYFAAFIPIFQTFYLLIVALKRWYRNRKAGRPADRCPLSDQVKRQAGAMVIVGLLYLPWIAYTASKLVSYVQGKKAAEGYVAMDLLRFVTAHLVAFSLGHLSEATPYLAWATLLFVVVALLGLFYHRGSRNEEYTPAGQPPRRNGALLVLCYLFIPLGLGYIINLIYPFTPSSFERTLMLAAPAWWLLLGAGLAWLWQRQHMVASLVTAGLLLAQAWSLIGFYTMPRYQDQDYRQMLAYVQARSTPQDVVLASYQWHLGLFHAYLPSPHPEFYAVPGWGEAWANDAERMQADLNQLVNQHPRLWFPAYQALGRLWESGVESTLNQLAFPTQVLWSTSNTKLSLYGQGQDLITTSLYLDQPGDANLAASADFGHLLTLEQAEVGSQPVETGRGIIPVSLSWRGVGDVNNDYHVNLRLTDINGHNWANRDSLPQGGRFSFKDLNPGQQIVDHQGLLVAAGTPPGEYQLRLSLRDPTDEHPLDLFDSDGQPQGVEVILANVQVVPASPSLPVDALPVQFPLSTDFEGKVQLLGYSLGDEPFRAGDTLKFTLFWQALLDGDQPYIVFAQLQDDTGYPVALSETPPVYPAEQWQAGTLLRDPHQVPIPAALPAGDYQLAVGLLRPDGSRLSTGRGDQVVLTSIRTEQRDHNFSPPSPARPIDASFARHARLVGYDLANKGPVQPGETLNLTIHWQAEEPFSRNYTVFAHLIDDDGHIVGQHDQVPGGGEYPTTSWVQGEYLVDGYDIPVNSDAEPGVYWIEIGFYDPLDGTRLELNDAKGQVVGDHLLLKETPIQVNSTD